MSEPLPSTSSWHSTATLFTNNPSKWSDDGSIEVYLGNHWKKKCFQLDTHFARMIKQLSILFYLCYYWLRMNISSHIISLIGIFYIIWKPLGLLPKVSNDREKMPENLAINLIHNLISKQLSSFSLFWQSLVKFLFYFDETLSIDSLELQYRKKLKYFYDLNLN